MRKLSPLVILLFFIFNTVGSLAQSKSKLIQSEDFGNIQTKYLKSDDQNNSYLIEIIIKNQKYIYTPEQDTLRLKSKEELSSFISHLNEGLKVIDDEEKDIDIKSLDYSIYKNKGYSDNKFLVIANADKSIITPMNKFFINQLVNWLKLVDFGKG